MKNGFINFIRSQGVVGLAVGFILGGAVSKLVSSIVEDIVNPVLNVILSGVSNYESMYIDILGAKILIGNLLSAFIDFLVIALVVYFGVVLLGLDKLDKKK